LLTAGLKRRRRILVKIREMAAHEVRDVAILCIRELVLDRQAGSIPGILARRAHIGLVAIGDDMLLGSCASVRAAVQRRGLESLITCLQLLASPSMARARVATSRLS
jgi:hypothetical protein